MAGSVRTGLRVLWVVICGLLAAILGELIAMFVILRWVPSHIDLTGDYFFTTALPGILLAGLVMWLVLRGVLRRAPVWYVLLFAVVYVGVQYLFLTAALNPLELRLQCAAAATMVCALILVWRVWQR